MTKIIVDSSCDLSEEMKLKLDADIVPFKINIDGKEYIDDENIDIVDMIGRMNESQDPIRTSCPAPGDFYKSYKQYDNIFVVTISSQLSGSYNSALIARDMILEEDPSKEIYIFDSKSASAGTSLVALRLREEIDKGLARDEIIKNLEEFIDRHHIYFILESLNNLIKNGRISKTKGLIASVLNFKPIMQGVKGSIEPVEKIRGTKKAFNRLVEIVRDSIPNGRGSRFIISHVDALDRAESIKKSIEATCDFDEIIIVHTTGLCSGYADDGGIVISYY